MSHKTATLARNVTLYAATALSVFCWWTSAPPAGLASTLSSAAWMLFWAWMILVLAFLALALRAIFVRLEVGVWRVGDLPPLRDDQARLTITAPRHTMSEALRALVDDPTSLADDVSVHHHMHQ